MKSTTFCMLTWFSNKFSFEEGTICLLQISTTVVQESEPVKQTAITNSSSNTGWAKKPEPFFTRYNFATIQDPVEEF